MRPSWPAPPPSAAAGGNHDAAAETFGRSLAAARSTENAWPLVPVLVDYGQWLAASGRDDDARELLSEARERAERMGAIVWLERIDAARSLAPVS